ncbi:hypothetical protein ACM66B_001633 [Microbotryomycetes sp. NB124-2]
MAPSASTTGINVRGGRSSSLTWRRVSCFAAVCANCITAGAIFTFPMWGAPFSRVLQLSAAQTSLLASSAILGEYVAAAGWGALADKRGPGAVSWSAAACFGAGYAGLAWRYSVAINRIRQGLPPAPAASLGGKSEWPLLCLFNLLVGCGTAASYFGSVVSSIKSTPPRHSGLAIGFPCAVFGLSPLFLSTLAGYFTIELSAGQTTEELDPGRWLSFLAVFLACVNFVSGFGLAEVPCDNNGLPFESKPAKDNRSSSTSSTRGDRLNAAPASRRVRRTGSATSLLGRDEEQAASETTALLGSSSSRSVSGSTSQSISSLLSAPSFWLFGALIFLSTGPAEMVLSQLGVIVECLLGVKIEPPTTSDGSTPVAASLVTAVLTLKRHEPRALDLRRLHVQVMSVSNTISRLLIGLLSDWVSYSSEPLPPHSPVLEEEDPRPKTLRQKLQDRFHRPPKVSRLSFVVVACLLLSATFAFTAFRLDKPAQLWLLSVVVGACYGLVFTLAPAIVRCVYPVQQFGLCWGLLTWFSAFGALLFTPLFGILLDRAQARQGGPVCYGRACFREVFVLSSVSCLLASGIVVLLWSRYWRGKVLTALDVSLTLTLNTRHLNARSGSIPRSQSSAFRSTNIRSSTTNTTVAGLYRRKKRSFGSFDGLRRAGKDDDDDDDQDWTDESPFGGKKRRQRQARKAGKVYGTHQIHKNVGSMTSESANEGSATMEHGQRTRVANGLTATSGLRRLGIDFKTEAQWSKLVLKQAGADASVVQRCAAVVRAYENVLECCYPRDRGQSQKQRPAVNDGVRRAARRVQSLVEMMAVQVGWYLEDNVAATINAAESGSDADDPFTVIEDDSSRQSIEQRKALLDEQTDATELVDEWYSACPEYCSGWVFAQHATSIILTSLDDSVPRLFEWLLETCVSYGSSNEAARFFEPMLDLALREPPSTYDCLDFAVGAARLNQSHAFFSALETVLLASSFADRLFYSDFLSLTRAELQPGCDDTTAALVSVICQVATCMVTSIQEATVTGHGGGDRLVKEIIIRVQQGLERVASSLLVKSRSQTCSIGHSAILELVKSLSELLQQIEFGIDLVRSRLPAFAFAAALLCSDDIRLDTSALETLEVIAQEPDSQMTCFLESVVKSTPSHVVASWCSQLAQTGLCSLEDVLREFTFEHYELLLDVAATQGQAVLDRTEFLRRRRGEEVGLNSHSADPSTRDISSEHGGDVNDNVVDLSLCGTCPVTPALAERCIDIDFEATPLGSTNKNRIASSAFSNGRPNSTRRPPPNRAILVRAREQLRAREGRGGRRSRVIADLTSEYEPELLDRGCSLDVRSEDNSMEAAEGFEDDESCSTSDVEIVEERTDAGQVNDSSESESTTVCDSYPAASELDELDVLVRPASSLLPTRVASHQVNLFRSSSRPTVAVRRGAPFVDGQARTKRVIKSMSPEKRKRRMRMVVHSTDEERDDSADELGM